MFSLGVYAQMHFDYLMKIGECKDADERARLCEADIAIAEDFRDECLSNETPVPRYSSFKTLAIYYEKNGDLDKAIAICKQAIVLGYTNDGTKGGMEKRLERLVNKRNG